MPGVVCDLLQPFHMAFLHLLELPASFRLGLDRSNSLGFTLLRLPLTFERRFQLAEYVEVKGAKLENGLLHVDLVREIPETMKPRRIAIAADNSDGAAKQIEADTVA